MRRGDLDDGTLWDGELATGDDPCPHDVRSGFDNADEYVNNFLESE